MKQRFIYTSMLILLIVSCTPSFFLPDQHINFSEEQRIVYSFHDTVAFINHNSELINYKISRFYYGTVQHTLTGTDYKGAQAYCEYELLTFCRINEELTCESVYENDILLKHNIYSDSDWVELMPFISECNVCFSVIKIMVGDRENEKKLKSLLFWGNLYKFELNTDIKIDELEINGTIFSDVYKTDIYSNNIKSVYYSNQYGIIKIEFLDDTLLQKNLITLTNTLATLENFYLKLRKTIKLE